MDKRIINLENCTIEELQRLIGINESNILFLEKQFHCNAIIRGEELIIQDISKEDFELLKTMIESLIRLVKQGITISSRDMIYSYQMTKSKK